MVRVVPSDFAWNVYELFLLSETHLILGVKRPPAVRVKVIEGCNDGWKAIGSGRWLRTAGGGRVNGMAVCMCACVLRKESGGWDRRSNGG